MRGKLRWVKIDQLWTVAEFPDDQPGRFLVPGGGDDSIGVDENCVTDLGDWLDVQPTKYGVKVFDSETEDEPAKEYAAIPFKIRHVRVGGTWTLARILSDGTIQEFGSAELVKAEVWGDYITPRPTIDGLPVRKEDAK